MSELISQESAPLLTPQEEAIQRLRALLPYLYTDGTLDRLREPMELDSALHHLDDTVRELTATAGVSTDHATAALLLAYAAGVARGEPDMRLLAALGERNVGPIEVQTAARALTSLTLAVIAWSRSTLKAAA